MRFNHDTELLARAKGHYDAIAYLGLHIAWLRVIEELGERHVERYPRT